MLITARTIDGLLRQTSNGCLDEALAEQVSGVSLEGAALLACTGLVWANANREDGRAFARHCAREFDIIAQAARCLHPHRAPDLPRVHPSSTPTWELFSVRSCSDLESTGYSQFFLRFQRALRAAGFSDELSRSIALNFQEMPDNVVQHSSQSPETPSPGVVGYHVEQRWLSFTVADLGQGVLSSLRSNPSWGQLAAAANALDAAIRCGASRKGARGTGFSTVQKALANLHGVLAFRSDDAHLALDGQGELRARSQTVPRLPGFQLSIMCALDRAAQPRPVPQRQIA